MSFTFVDLFAGIGGFHNALHEVGGECVFASEWDDAAAAVYELNWGVRPHGDIVPLTEPEVRVPPHDVLCAGFPCQPFSKSGHQRGMAETRGTLFWNICRVLEAQKPPLVLLENVRNLAGPRHRDTWTTIVRSLRDLGYWVTSEPTVLSPHWLPPGLGGTPQVRERVFIAGVHVGRDLAHVLPSAPFAARGPVASWDPQSWDLERDLPLDDDAAIPDLHRYQLTDAEEYWLDVWDDFLASVPADRLPGFPIWADAFVSEAVIPDGTPLWKANFLAKNASFYREHKGAIDAWLARHDGLVALPPSRRKLEWQAQDTPRSLRNCVLHFRPSGIRAKKPSYVPALVAITQTSVIGSRGRRLTPREAARLQGLPDTFIFGDQPNTESYKQLGNAVARGAVLWALAGVTRGMSAYLPAHLRDLVPTVPSAPPLTLAA